MIRVTGIDEAGLGPVLGPLVVSSAAFDVPDELARASLWGPLKTGVSKKVPKSSYRIAIGDSKKIFNRNGPAGIEPLERSVLALLAGLGDCPVSLHDCLRALLVDPVRTLADYPWYADDLPLPRVLSAMNVKLIANSVRDCFLRAGIRLAGLQARPVHVAEYNRVVTGTNNKHTAAFGFTAGLILRAIEACPAGMDLRICVDRQGGRTRYLQPLQRILPEGRFRIIEESESFSHYRVDLDGRRIDLEFNVGADDLHLPVALASMVSKYLRELFMELINAFWLTHQSDLVPTAGYHTDGHRFLEQIEPHRLRLRIPVDRLQRCR